MLTRPESGASRLRSRALWGWTPRRRPAYVVMAAIIAAGCFACVASVSHDRGTPVTYNLLRLLPGNLHLNRLIEPESPVVARWAELIEGISSDPLMQISLAEATVERNVVYWDDLATWGVEDYPPTPTEIEALRVRRGWRDAHEDCDGRAVVLASLLRRLGHEAWINEGRPVEIEGRTIEHAWVETRLNGQVGRLFDLSDNMKTINVVHTPPDPSVRHLYEELKLLSWAERDKEINDPTGPSHLRVWRLWLIGLATLLAACIWDRKTAIRVAPPANQAPAPTNAEIGNGLPSVR